MSRTLSAVVAVVLVTLGGSVVAQQQAAPAPAAAPVAPPPADLPEWAYTPAVPGAPPPPAALPADDSAVISLPGTTRTFTRGQLRAVKETMDWYPEDRHGTIPDIVRFGKTGARQCTLCHTPDGSGRPENAPISAYHPTYFIQQMQDYRAGLRKSADPRKANTNAMIAIAQATTVEEDRAAAQYFAQQPYPRKLKVIESKTAPKVRLQGGMYMAVPAAEGGSMIPIKATEIVEVPDSNVGAEVRDTRMGYTAYVPPGTLARGKQVALRAQCGTCHGANFEGLGPIPALAGRSPSFTMRQLYDMKQGARRGPWAEVMKSALSGMSVQDMMNVSAYAASLAPPAPAAARGTR